MFCLIWNYEVEASNAAEFEKEYGRNGSWFKFFESCDDYLGHDLLKGRDGSAYIVINKWMEKDAYDQHVNENKAEYDQLTDKLSALFKSETQYGEYDQIQ